MQNQQTTNVRTGITIFIVISLAISLFQQFSFLDNSRAAQQPTNQQKATEQSTTNHTKINNLQIMASDGYSNNVKKLMSKNQFNAQTKDYQFQGNKYWINFFLTNGHVLIAFYIITKYQQETENSKKFKWMGIGLFTVVVWMFVIPGYKYQAISVKYNGNIIYDNEKFDQSQLMSRINEVKQADTFGLDYEPTTSENIGAAPESQDTVEEIQIQNEEEVRTEVDF